MTSREWNSNALLAATSKSCWEPDGCVVSRRPVEDASYCLQCSYTWTPFHAHALLLPVLSGKAARGRRRRVTGGVSAGQM